MHRGGVGGEPARLADVISTESMMARLPPGRHGLPRDFVASNQRLRLIAAMLRVLAERGYPETTIGDITAEASVSRAAFYDQFEDKEACFLAAFDLAADWFCEQVEAAAATGEGEWHDRIRAGAVESLRLLAVNPQVAQLIAIEAVRAGRFGRQRREAFLARIAAVLRADHPGRDDLPDAFADLLLGGFVAQVAHYVDADRTAQLTEATRTLVEYLLVPYLGGEVARVAAAEMPAG